MSELLAGPTGAFPRWAMYATTGRDLMPFAETVRRAPGGWKPVVVHPERLEDALRAVRPLVVVVATDDVEGEALLGRTFAAYGAAAVVVDDRRLPLVAKLLELLGEARI